MKLLIGSTRVVTVRSGALVAVDELRRHLLSDRTLVTAVDLLGFLVSAMTNRMEVVIYDLTQDIDDVEDALLGGGSVPPPQTLSELRRRIFRTRRQVNGTQQVLAPMTTDPALALDAEDRATLDRASNHVARYLVGLDECRTRVQMLEDQIDAQRADTMTRSSLNLTIVATVFLPLSFITGLLGMNVGGIPDEHNPLGFWLLSCVVRSPRRRSCGMGSVSALDAAVFQRAGRHLLFRHLHHDAWLWRCRAAKSLATTRALDRHSRGAGVRLFDGFLVRCPAPYMGAATLAA